MIRIGPSIRPKYFPGVTVDPDAQAFITAASITDPTQQSAINTLVTDLKGYGIWSKMKAIWPFVGGTSSTHKWNLKDPRDLDAAFRLVFSGGITHSSTGVLFGGVNGYADSFINNQTHLQQNSVSHSIYSRTTTISNSIIAGLGAFNLLTLGKTTTSSIGLYTQIQTIGADYINYNAANDLGLLIGNRTSSTSVKLYLNSVKHVDTSKNSQTTENLKYFIGARNNGGTASTFTNAEIAFAHIGDGLTDTEAANLSISVEKYQTTLGRSVNPWYDNGNLLIDLYPSASAAYSTRKLRNYYIGAAIRVRRSSDNAEQDIYFDVNGNLDENALTTFVGANNGFVTTWYDQSGNLRNLTETSATAQPQIVNSGSINKVNNDIVLSFDGTNDKLSFTLSSNLSQPATIFIVNRNSQLGSKPIFSSSDANNRWQIYRSGIGNYINIFAGSVLSSNDTTQQQVIIYSLFNGANSSISINNNVAVNGNAGTQQTNAFRVGVDNSITFGNNDVSELIIYNSNESANRTSILDNINTYYSIY